MRVSASSLPNVPVSAHPGATLEFQTKMRSATFVKVPILKVWNGADTRHKLSRSCVSRDRVSATLMLPVAS